MAVGYGAAWQPLIDHCLQAGQEAGHKINPDHNDGDPEGVSVAQFNVNRGVRGTSVSSFLDPALLQSSGRLVIATETIASKILFEGTKAIGVEMLDTVDDKTDNQTVVYAKQEVILTAGCFQSAHLLLISGVGPTSDLEAQDIPVVRDQPNVGKHIQDHSAMTCEFIVDPSIPGHNQLLHDPAALKAAQEEYEATQTGPLAMFGASASIVFPRLPRLFASSEFASLPPKAQTYLSAPTRPSAEIWMHSGPQLYQGPCPPDASILVLEGLCQNNLSRGSLKLTSKNPRDLPEIDPGYLSHPFDLRIAVETLREMVRLANTPAFKTITRSVLHGPRREGNDDDNNNIHKNNLASLDSDDAALESFIRSTLTQGFHSMSACIMGAKTDPKRVVNSDFRVEGLSNLRIADMSVCPILTTNHTQINAYLIAERCAEVIVNEMK